MTCKECQTKYTYNTTCNDCGIRLIMSAYPVSYRAKQMSEYIKSYFKGDTDSILEKARQQWAHLKSHS